MFLPGFACVRYRGMTLQQRQHQLTPGRLLLQRCGRAFQQSMQLAEAIHQIRVAVQRGTECRRVVGWQFKFGQQ
ncbi:hypothetical protein D3C81_2160040 [compost metagenome]